MYNVICVKFGTKYSSEFVNKLYNDIKNLTQSDFKFYCYTDDPLNIDPNINIIEPLGRPTLKRVWNKLRLFDKNMPFKGKTYFFDLDVKILKDPLINLDDWSKLTLVDSHWKTGKLYNRLSNYDVKINSSVMAWDASNPNLNEYWDHFNSGFRDYYLRKYVGIDRFIVHEDLEYNTFDHQYIQSWKYQRKVDYDACVLTFEEIDVGIEDLK
jgi:HKD family nuclease